MADEKRNSLLLAAAHATAIATGLHQLSTGMGTVLAPIPITHTPTLTLNGGQEPDCCIPQKIPPTTITLTSFDDIRLDAERLARYLKDVVAPHM